MLLTLTVALGCQRGCEGCGISSKAGADASEYSQYTDMVDAGQKPWTKLEVGRWTGYRYTTVIETNGSLSLQGQKPVEYPTLVMTVRITTKRGTADPILRERDFKTLALVEEEAVIDSIELRGEKFPKEYLDHMNEQLSPMAGTSNTMLVAEDAEVVEVRAGKLGGVEPPAELKSFLDSAWQSQPRYPFRLPGAPVGIGAEWHFRETLSAGGVKIIQVSTMRLVGLDEDLAVIKVSSRQEAPSQPVPDPILPGQTATLERYRGDGTGDLVVDRVTGVPLRGKFTTSATMTLDVERGGKPEKFTVVAMLSMLITTTTGEDAGAELVQDDDPGPQDAAADDSAAAVDAPSTGEMRVPAVTGDAAP